MASETKGRVLHAARSYDLLAWLLLLGRERAFRDRLVQLAGIQPGEDVLDIGCGTGSLAIAAKQRVGASGVVHGVDASPEMIARAQKKARKAGVDVTFRTGIAEALPFQERQFDVVLSTLMLHHLPRETRRQAAREIRRVLEPGGRVLPVDFGRSSAQRKGLLSHVHRHGRVEMVDIVALLEEAGFEIGETGAVGMLDLNFVVGKA
jgi:ubiquinone/menaquinone biosynthesis C-methylase UbiE